MSEPQESSEPLARVGSIGFHPCERAPDELAPLSADDPRAQFGAHSYCAGLTVGEGHTDIVLATDRTLDELRRSGLDGRTVVFWHPGGPGISPANLLKRSSGVLDPEQFAVLAWDGPTAEADAGACGEHTLSFGVDRDAADLLWEAAAAVANECRASVPDEVASSAVEADYLESIRVALGLDTIRIWASSFGAAIAERYAANHPGQLESAVFVSPFFEDVPTLKRLSAMSNTMASVEARWASLCAKQCTPDLRPIARRGWAAVRTAVLDRRPRVGSGTQTLSRTQFDQALVSASRESDSDSDILRMVEAAHGGDGSQVAQVSDAYFFGVDRAAYYAALCPHMVLSESARAVAESRTKQNASYALLGEFAPCTGWAPVDEARKRISRATAAKMLVLVGEQDVLSPPVLLESLGWTSGTRRCELARARHTPRADSNPIDLITGFLVSGDLDADLVSRLCRGGGR